MLYQMTDTPEPSPENMRDPILCYIRDRILTKGSVSAGQAQEFLHYIGLDAKNLRTMLELEEPYMPLTDQEYTWDQVCGKHAELDLNDYMKQGVSRIQKALGEKQEEVINRAADCIVQGLREKGDAAFACFMLEPEAENSLGRLLQQEKQTDYGFLIDINKNTFQQIKEKDESARRERPGIFGHRQEALDDLLETVDLFLSQRYEMYRYKAVETVCDQLTENFVSHAPVFPSGSCPPVWASVFEQMNLYSIFEREYLRSFLTDSFLTSDMLWEAAERCKALAAPPKPAEPEPEPAPMPAPEPVPVPEPVPAPEPVPVPEPVPEPEPAADWDWDDDWSVPQETVPQVPEAEEEKEAPGHAEERPDLSLLEEGVENQCIIIQNDQILLNVYDIMTPVDTSGMTLLQGMDKLKEMQREGLKPVFSRTYELRDQEDLLILLKNEAFVQQLKKSIEAVKQRRQTIEKLTEWLLS